MTGHFSKNTAIFPDISKISIMKNIHLIFSISDLCNSDKFDVRHRKIVIESVSPS